MHKRLAIVLTATLCPIAGWTAGAWHGAESVRIRAVDATVIDAPREPDAVPDASGWLALPYPLIEEPPSDDRRDLYGNDVSPAVARYTHDAAGAVREEHSPATEVPRLKPPTT